MIYLKVIHIPLEYVQKKKKQNNKSKLWESIKWIKNKDK